MDVESLVNKGLRLINVPEVLPESRTVVVVGPARSGTSVAAGTLAHLGVFMGDRAQAPVYEDTELATAFEDVAVNERLSEAQREHALRRARDIIRRYDIMHDLWGWKRPSSVAYLDTVHAELTNPIYIVLFKDLFSIANRNVISMGAEIMPRLRHAMEDYDRVLRFLEEQRPYALLVSQAKALRYREEFVDAVTTFVGLDPRASRRQAALDFITPTPTAYLQASHIRGQHMGCVDVVDASRVAGWATRSSSDEPVIVEVTVNGEVVAAAPARGFRKDLQKHGVSTTGRAAFEIQLPRELQPGDEVCVRPRGTTFDLRNSPTVFQPAASSD